MTLREQAAIREAEAGDAEALSALASELGYPTPPGRVLERLATLTRVGAAALVAVRGERVVAFATFQQTRSLHRPPDLRLTSLVVSYADRGSGVGAMLVAEVERRAAAEGCARVEVTSGSPRTQAHAFYQHLGYETQSLRFVKAVGSSAPPVPGPPAG